MNAKVHILRINCSGCLLSTSNQEALSQLAREVSVLADDSDSNVETILICFEPPHDTEDDAWVKELRHEAYFEQIFERMMRVRNIISEIHNSSKRWVFATNSDCLGPIFDLALACDARLAFSESIMVGFPGIKAGLVPFAGGFESVLRQRLRTRRQWLESCVFSPAQAKRFELWHLVAACEDWRQKALDWVENNEIVAQQQMSIGYDTDRQGAVNEYFEQAASFIEERKIDCRPRERFNSASRIIKKNEDPQRDGLVVLYLAALHLVSSEYIDNLSRRLLLDSQKKIQRDHPNSQAVYVDLRFLVPPAKPLVRLVEAGHPIVFFGGDEKLLIEGLELMFNRLVRALGAVAAQDFWAEGVSWVTKDVPENHPGIVCRWQANDRVVVNCQGQQVVALRFLGNRGSAECGGVRSLMGPSKTRRPLLS